MVNSNARALRKSMTRQEVKLWQRLRELRTLGHLFRRQSPLVPYIVDFECRRSRVIVEVDGHQHGTDENRRRDDARDKALTERGYRILRFSNGDVDRELDGVMQAICLALASVDENTCGIGGAIPPRHKGVHARLRRAMGRVRAKRGGGEKPAFLAGLSPPGRSLRSRPPSPRGEG
jgi:very-short-patch-repair endonuclease